MYISVWSLILVIVCSIICGFGLKTVLCWIDEYEKKYPKDNYTKEFPDDWSPYKK
jgi:hypothetical protein